MVWSRIESYVAQLQRRTSDEHELPVAAGSSVAGDDKATAPYQLSHAVKLNVVAAVDHLDALCKLAWQMRVLHIAAPASLARGALEAGAAAVWLLSPKSRDERASRTLRWHLKDIADGDTAAKDAGIPVPTSRADRITKVERVAKARGLDWNRLSKHRLTSSEMVKCADDFTKSPLAVLLPWRVASAFAHGRPWVYIGFSEIERRAGADPTIVNLKITSSLDRVLFLAWAASSTLSDAMGLWEKRASA